MLGAFTHTCVVSLRAPLELTMHTAFAFLKDMLACLWTSYSNMYELIL